MASRTGRCLCGAARYELADAPASYGACHCGFCRRWTGGVEMGLQVMPDAITWTAQDSVRTYKSSDWAERGFCATCGSSLFWRLTMAGEMQGMLSLSVGSLDDMTGLKFSTEVYVDHKPASHAFTDEDGRQRMTEADVMAMIAGPDYGG